MRKTIFVLILGVACMNATAQTASNLLPNGDFSYTNQLIGWTDLGPGRMAFNGGIDATGGSVSGSMSLISPQVPIIAPPLFTAETAKSSCFAVSRGAPYSLGGQVQGGAEFGAADATFSCTAYSTTDCSGNSVDDLPPSVAPAAFGSSSFSSLQTVSGNLDASARSANCSAKLEIGYSDGSAFATANFDDLFFVSTPPLPSTIALDGYLSGSWYDPSQSGQGFDLDFTDQQNQLVAYWFSFTPDGKSPMWLYAQGTYDSSANSVTIPAAILSGTRFSPNFNPAAVQRTLWGTLTFTFSDCNHGNVSWNSTVPGYGSGSFPIVRLTRIKGAACPQ